jgi:hypothetical protein
VLNGSVDYVASHHVLGWVWDSAAPSWRLNLVALKDAKIVSDMVANLYRQDLLRAGIGDGHYAFDLWFPSEAPCEIAIQMQDGQYKIPLNMDQFSQPQIEDVIDIVISPSKTVIGFSDTLRKMRAARALIEKDLEVCSEAARVLAL